MQQNQKYDKNSLVDNKELRYKVSLELCNFLNNLIRKKTNDFSEKILVNGKDYITERDLFTKEDVNNFINDSKVFEKYVLINNQNHILNKLKNKSFQYKEDNNYRTMKNPMQARDMNLLLDLNDSFEADEYNQNIINHSFDKDTEKVVAYELLDKYSNTEPENLYPTNEEEAFNQGEQVLYDNQINWALNINKALDYDKKIVERVSATIKFKRSQANTQLIEKYQSIFSLLIPSKKASNVAYFISDYLNIFNNYIIKKFPNIKEFKLLIDKGKNKLIKKGKSVGDVFGFTKFTQSAAQLPNLFETNEINKKMIEAGIIKKGLGTDYYFVDANGKLANADEVFKSFKDGELTNGYKIVNWTEEEKQQSLTMRQGAYALTKLVDYINLGKKLNIECQFYEEEFKIKLSSLNTIISPFKEEIDKLENGIEKFRQINEFMEKNKELIKEIDDLKLTVLEQKKIFKDREVCKNYMNDVSKGNSALNYDKLEKLASTKTEGIHASEIQDILSGYPESKELNELLNSNFSKMEDIQKPLGVVKPYIRKRDILTNIALIKDMNDKDNEYQHRGSFGKLWYKKSYNRMMATRNKLITDLINKGVSQESINQLSRQDNHDIAKLSQEIIKTVKEYQINQIENLKALHKTYLADPKTKIDALNTKKSNLEKVKNSAKSKAIDLKEEMFIKFKKTQPELFKNNEKMKISDLEGLLDKKTTDIKNAFKKYQTDPANKEAKEAFDATYKNYKEKSDEIKALQDEIDKREKCLKNGEVYKELDNNIQQNNLEETEILQNQVKKSCNTSYINDPNINGENIKTTDIAKNNTELSDQDLIK